MIFRRIRGRDSNNDDDDDDQSPPLSERGGETGHPLGSNEHR
jgi:hypothetical protein